MSEGKEKKASPKKDAWKSDSDITMTVKKGLTMKPDDKLRMKFQEAKLKKREETR